MSIPPIPGPNNTEPPGPPVPSPSLMVVDDTPANLALLEEILAGRGYQVRCFPRGAMALAAAAHSPPDLILLDISMPGIDGFEVCTRLKADSALAPVPVIFLSAQNETSSILRGFQCGGVDYVTKPFQIEELLARVRTHLEVRRLQHQLQRHNAHLDELVRRRTAELAAARDRLAILDRAKTEFLQLISHELRTPLNGLLGVGELLLEACPADPAHESLRELFTYSRDRLVTTVDDALLFAQIEAEADRFTGRALLLGELLQRAASRVAEFARVRGIPLPGVPPAPIPVHADPDLCVKALQALLETAIRFATPPSELRLALVADEPEPALAIEARGCAIPPASLPRFFEVLAIPEAIVPGGDLGLAAPLAQRILSLFGATVRVENLHPPGIRFVVQFQSVHPVPPPPAGRRP